jgi:hypothetical protein
VSREYVAIGVERDGLHIVFSGRKDGAGFTIEMSVPGAACLAASLSTAASEAGEAGWSSVFDLRGDLQFTRKG